MTVPVLLLHCSGSSGAQWRTLVTALGTMYVTFSGTGDSHDGAATRLGCRIELQGFGEICGILGRSVDLSAGTHLLERRAQSGQGCRAYDFDAAEVDWLVVCVGSRCARQRDDQD